MSTSAARSTAVADIATRAAAYSMPGVIVNGNDFSAVAVASTNAVERARRGAGPTLIENKIYRHRAIPRATATVIAQRMRLKSANWWWQPYRGH